MSTFFRFNGLATRVLALPLALLCIAGFSTAAQAQVAPTLLPYKLSVIAGGATASPTAAMPCPASGLRSTDAFGDGCLATEVLLAGPRYVTVDPNGVIYFTDTHNAIVRRIDPLTGVITTVAGGASTNPATGASCGLGSTAVALDSLGDGCPAILVHLDLPMGIAVSPTGDIYFSDNGNDDVRKVDHITGIISNAIGNTVASGFPAYGYKTSNTSTAGPVIAATQSYSNFPYGITFDAAGNLYLADEGNQDISVTNLGASTITLQGQTIAPGAINKFVGYGNANSKVYNSGDCPNFTAASTGSRGGCYFAPSGTPGWTDGEVANISNIDNPLDVAVDASGNVFFANYFNYNVGEINSANIIKTYAGILNTKVTFTAPALPTRAKAATFGIGNVFNTAVDASGDLYISDGSNGIVWRVDAGTQAMYAAAGGAYTPCSGATDAVGDGCPATQAVFAKTTGSGASLLPGGAAGLAVDPSGDLLITDTTTNVVRMAATGINFGSVGANQPTQTVVAHFAASDGPTSNPFSITSGSSNFTLGAFHCPPANSDGTTDCTVAVTATPSALGPFSGTLTVVTANNATANFTLTGNFVNSPLTRTTLGFTTPATCASSTVATTTAITFNAAVVSTGTPTGTITFYSNGVQIGAPQTISNAGKASLTNTFSTVGTYAITAKYSGDGSFTGSTSSVTTITSSLPTYSVTAATAPVLPCIASDGTKVAAPCVNQGQTALYSFNIVQTVYSGTITFACGNLPANASCVFSPASVSNTGCTSSSTVTLSILTQQAGPLSAGFGVSGPGSWQVLAILPGLLLALWVGIRRRKSPLRYGQIWLALALLLAATGLTACGKASNTTLATPPGTYAVTVTANGSVSPSGTVAPLSISLTVVK